jgi:hypothetical protein
MAITTDLSGKTAVITGSNSGIGLGIAKELAKAGADVVLNSFTDREEDHALAAEIAAQDRRHGALYQGRHVEGRRMPRPDRAGRRLRYPRQQRGHPACRRDPRFPGREMGRDHRDQPQFRLPHHRRRPADDARGRLGPGRSTSPRPTA